MMAVLDFSAYDESAAWSVVYEWCRGYAEGSREVGYLTWLQPCWRRVLA